jgi:hypothetical protein
MAMDWLQGAHQLIGVEISADHAEVAITTPWTYRIPVYPPGGLSSGTPLPFQGAIQQQEAEIFVVKDKCSSTV